METKMAMKISSPITSLHKAVFPFAPLALGLHVYLTSEGLPRAIVILMVIMCIGITIVALVVNLPLKRVKFDGKVLLVSNYLKEISIPLSGIVDIQETRLSRISPRKIVLTLREPSEFGSRIKFVPRVPKAIAERLREALLARSTD
jgi:hypothetical protein